MQSQKKPKPRITLAELMALAIEFAIPLPALRAFLKVESAGAGFLPDGRLKILFERHWFYKLSGSVPVSKTRPDLANPKPGGYKGGAAEHKRLADAMAFHKEGAMQSASYGAMQVMGFNFKKAGYKNVFDMVKSFEESEANQIRGGLNFCKNTPGLLEAIRGLPKEASARKAAYLYNGKNYEQNNYHTLLMKNYEAYARQHK